MEFGIDRLNLLLKYFYLLLTLLADFIFSLLHCNSVNFVVDCCSYKNSSTLDVFLESCITISDISSNYSSVG